jgi:hypothetical protein
MISIIAASVVGSWSYAGFLAEPSRSPTPSAAPSTPPPASAPTVPAPRKPEEPAAPRPPEPPSPSLTPSTTPVANSAVKAPVVPPPVVPPPVVPPPVAAPPTLYRSTDASGQAWEHPDPVYLSSFVEARNRSIAGYSQAPPQSSTYTLPR